MSEGLPLVVAGHLCLDLTPSLTNGLPPPGGLTEAGPLHVSCGGAVANVGSALWRLGCPVRLIGLVGDDRLGEMVISVLKPLGSQPGIRIAPGQSTSYSIVIATQGSDRAFLHCPGANAIFTSADVRNDDLKAATWLHFGYPPVMRVIAADGGRELATLFCRAKQSGLRTSLDFCSIGGSAASTDWRTVLRNCARAVTVFAPSIEELRTALREPERHPGDIADIQLLARAIFAMGFPVILIKLGTYGLYLGTTNVEADLADWQLGPQWRAREFVMPCFRASVVNTTGAGDCAIAGFIASVANGSSPEEALTMAAASGACSVEAADASSGMRSMEELRKRIASGWERIESMFPGGDWIYDRTLGIWSHA